ncbi:MAG TPA: lactate utilization protein [Roseiflexaceae bacterium]|nr:lactate utilization protein [Roseiflexaceae bacterium]
MTSAREAMLARIRSGLAQSGPWLEAQAAAAPHTPPPFVHPSQDDLAEQFATELVRVAGHIHRCADEEGALEAIAGIVGGRAGAGVIAWDRQQIGLAGLDALLDQQGARVLDAQESGEPRAQRLQRLEPAQICISGADVGIAESGTLLLVSAPGRPRMASLLAPVFLAVLWREQLVRGLGEALAAVRARYGDDPLNDHSSIVLLTGPSRTGDIEMTLTLGVHGPGEIHVVLIDSDRPAPAV